MKHIIKVFLACAMAFSVVQAAPVKPKAAPAKPAPVKPKAAPAKPAPAKAAPKKTTTFSSCAEAKKAGVTNMKKGTPGYSTKLDRDGDGVACNK